MPGTEPAAEQEPQASALPAPGRRRSVCRVLFRGCLTGLLLAGAAETGRVLFGNNCHTVLAGRVYRCAQPSPAGLKRMVQDYGIRTVVNLRGCCNPLDWYLDECRATHHLDVAQEDISLSAGRLPSVHEMRRLVEVLDRSAYPLLLHCRRGSDRTGLVATVILLLNTDIDLGSARVQMGLRYGHIALGRPANLNRFFDLYQDWLRSQGREHGCAAFRQWIEQEYCPGECRCEIEPLEANADGPVSNLLSPPGRQPARVTRVPVGKPIGLHVRAHNTSLLPWRLRPESNAGIHLCYNLTDAGNHQLTVGKSGLFTAEVPPGQSIDLTITLPALTLPGRYYLFVDMTAEQHCEFYKTGSEPLLWELEARDETEF